ncbi:hypothetical protein M0R45_021745 [Rubus argutus]|uniref:Alliinase C-terminal domain-containing protein n=1 Tax=Rubus argutus TaxID=59490 RepID=A0AAW1XDW7_RUBAR
MCVTDHNPNPANQHPSANGNGTRRSSVSPDTVLNLEQGDPAVFEPYWKKMGDKCTMVISGSQWMSYISDFNNTCWFLEPELEGAVRRLHRTVGNAVVDDDRHIVVGTGSTQLYQAALYALTSPVDLSRSVSCLPLLTTRHIQMRRTISVQGFTDGQYTTITAPVDQEIMYFTFSKSTGHAGSRIGWAIVKDKEIAIKMSKFVELSSLGVSKDSQQRAAKIMGVICDGYQNCKAKNSELFFEHCQKLMAQRWERLREVVERNEFFSLPKYPKEYCLFSGEFNEPHPAFAWLKCEEDIDLEKFLRGCIKVQGRSGRKFGTDQKYVRISMLSKDEVFDQFLERLPTVKAISNGY